MKPVFFRSGNRWQGVTHLVYLPPECTEAQLVKGLDVVKIALASGGAKPKAWQLYGPESVTGLGVSGTACHLLRRDGRLVLTGRKEGAWLAVGEKNVGRQALDPWFITGVICLAIACWLLWPSKPIDTRDAAVGKPVQYGYEADGGLVWRDRPNPDAVLWCVISQGVDGKWRVESQKEARRE